MTDPASPGSKDSFFHRIQVREGNKKCKFVHNQTVLNNVRYDGNGLKYSPESFFAVRIIHNG